MFNFKLPDGEIIYKYFYLRIINEFRSLILFQLCKYLIRNKLLFFFFSNFLEYIYIIYLNILVHLFFNAYLSILVY